jgi:hypothetical protein
MLLVVLDLATARALAPGPDMAVKSQSVLPQFRAQKDEKHSSHSLELSVSPTLSRQTKAFDWSKKLASYKELRRKDGKQIKE